MMILDIPFFDPLWFVRYAMNMYLSSSKKAVKPNC